MRRPRWDLTSLLSLDSKMKPLLSTRKQFRSWTGSRRKKCVFKVLEHEALMFGAEQGRITYSTFTAERTHAFNVWTLRERKRKSVREEGSKVIRRITHHTTQEEGAYFTKSKASITKLCWFKSLRNLNYL